MMGGRIMKIVLFYATETPKALKLVDHFEKANQEKGHTVECVEARKYLQLEHKVDLAEPDTIYGFGVSGLSEQSKKDMLLLAKMLKNEYINKPAFIFSGTKKDFLKIKRNLQSILRDKNFDVVVSKVNDYDSVEMDEAIEHVHDVYRQYYKDRTEKKSNNNPACNVCEVCTEIIE